MKHIGVATGFGTDVVATDADDETALAAMKAKYGEPHARTRRGGHWYWAHPGDGKVKSKPIGKELKDFFQGGNADSKGDGGYVIAPPSEGKTWTAGIPDRDSLPVLPPRAPARRGGIRPGRCGVSGRHVRGGCSGNRRLLP